MRKIHNPNFICKYHEKIGFWPKSWNDPMVILSTLPDVDWLESLLKVEISQNVILNMWPHVIPKRKRTRSPWRTSLPHYHPTTSHSFSNWPSYFLNEISEELVPECPAYIKSNIYHLICTEGWHISAENKFRNEDAWQNLHFGPILQY